MTPSEQIVKPLLEWYDKNARILPWRENPEPYRVWISEIMLQQTRVEAVKPFFERFMEALPDVEALAGAEEDRLLKLWEGLGYYNRARNLQKAAGIMMQEYGGRLPDRFEKLLLLPGIGSYTAGAIASIAYGEAVPAVDGNVLRIIARVTADDSDILEARVKKTLEENLLPLIPSGRPGDFNQALMELGATVCVPNGAPKCEICPWIDMCLARQQERIMEIPFKKKKKPRVIECKTILIIQDEERVAIRKRPAGGLLAGMYEFPMLEGHCDREQVLKYMEKFGYRSIRINRLEDSKHIFSHREWHMIGYAIRVDELEKMSESVLEPQLLLAHPEDTERRYPIPAAFLAYSRYLNIKIGQQKYKTGESTYEITDSSNS